MTTYGKLRSVLKIFLLFRFTVVGSMGGCLLISSFPSIGLQVL